MTSNIKEFSLGLDKFSASVPEDVGKITRSVGLQGSKRVVDKSPVKTGRYRGNHQVTLDGPAAGEVDIEDKQGGATVAKGAAVIARAKPFGQIFLSNHLSYAGVIEDGSSKQAPQGVYGLTFEELQQIFR